MASQEQVDAVKAYLEQQFKGYKATTTAEHGVNFRLTRGEKRYELRVGEAIFEELDAGALPGWLAEHHIGQVMQMHGPKSIVILSKLSEEPEWTSDPEVEKQDEALLSRIQRHIGIAFPGETVSANLDVPACRHVFEIGRDWKVEVHRSFLDADDGLGATQRRLDRWAHDGQFRALKLRPGDKLVISNDEPQVTRFR